VPAGRSGRSGPPTSAIRSGQRPPTPGGGGAVEARPDRRAHQARRAGCTGDAKLVLIYRLVTAWLRDACRDGSRSGMEEAGRGMTTDRTTPPPIGPPPRQRGTGGSLLRAYPPAFVSRLRSGVAGVETASERRFSTAAYGLLAGTRGDGSVDSARIAACTRAGEDPTDGFFSVAARAVQSGASDTCQLSALLVDRCLLVSGDGPRRDGLTDISAGRPSSPPRGGVATSGV